LLIETTKYPGNG
jgi:ATP-dependent Lon protease